MACARTLLSLLILLVAVVEDAHPLRVVRVVKYQPATFYMVKGRPVRPFPRSFKLADVKPPVMPAAPAEPAVIILNETAVPFTVSKSALSTAEYEANPKPDEAVEEGTGPAASFDNEPASPLNSASDDKQHKRPADGKKIDDKQKDLKVEFSDVHPVYVKPPNNFKPVIYATRRVDGVRSTARSSYVPTLLPPPMPYPYPYPRGLSAWTLGGTRSVQRGSFWESLASDEALTIPTTFELASRSGKRKFAAKPMTTYQWVMVPATRRMTTTTLLKSVPVVAYQPVYNRKRVGMPSYRPPLAPPQRRKSAAPANKPTTRPAVKSASPSSSSTGIKTKLPVGLTSWMFGGVRDLNGKHWNMPELAVEKIDVVPAAAAPPRPNDNKRDFFNGKDLMTSDEVETFEPRTGDQPSTIEVDESDSSRTRPVVVFDEEPDNFNTVSV